MCDSDTDSNSQENNSLCSAQNAPGPVHKSILDFEYTRTPLPEADTSELGKAKMVLSMIKSKESMNEFINRATAIVKADEDLTDIEFYLKYGKNRINSDKSEAFDIEEYVDQFRILILSDDFICDIYDIGNALYINKLVQEYLTLDSLYKIYNDFCKQHKLPLLSIGKFEEVGINATAGRSSGYYYFYNSAHINITFQEYSFFQFVRYAANILKSRDDKRDEQINMQKRISGNVDYYKKSIEPTLRAERERLEAIRKEDLDKSKSDVNATGAALVIVIFLVVMLAIYIIAISHRGVV